MKARFTLIEYPAVRTADSTQFFEQVFGWSHTDHGDQYSDVWFAPQQSVAFQADPQAANQPPLAVFDVDELDQARVEIEAAGGRVTVEPFDFPGGRRFHFAEPSGNVLALWTPTAAS